MKALQTFRGVQKREDTAPVVLKYRPKSAVFQDQFGNEVEGVFCTCGKVGLARDFQYFTNYGGMVRKGHLCEECFEELAAVSDRVTRNRKKISHAFLGERSNWGPANCIK